MRLLHQSVKLGFGHSQHLRLRFAVLRHDKSRLPPIIGMEGQNNGSGSCKSVRYLFGLLNMKQPQDPLLNTIDIGIYAAMIYQTLFRPEGDFFCVREESVDYFIRRFEGPLLSQQLSDRLNIHTDILFLNVKIHQKILR